MELLPGYLATFRVIFTAHFSIDLHIFNILARFLCGKSMLATVRMINIWKYAPEIVEKIIKRELGKSQEGGWE